MSAKSTSISHLCSRSCARTSPRYPPRPRSLTTSTSLTPQPTSFSIASSPAQPPSPKALTLPQSRLSCYFDTFAPTASQLSYANHFFASSSPHFLFSAARFRTFPASSAPEVAFLGRSNVGKSSLLNALLIRTTKKLAHVSSKPGRTREMNAFGVGGEVMREKIAGREGMLGEGGKRLEKRIMRGGVTVVDMPGYGKGSREEWGREIMKYLSGRRQLRRAFLLIDAEHGIKAADEQTLELLRGAGTPHQVVLSKVDKLLWPGSRLPSPEKMEANLARLRELCEAVREKVQPRNFRGSVALGEILTCSAEKAVEQGKKLGVDDLRWAVLQAAGLECDEHGRRRKLDADLFQQLAEEEEVENADACLEGRPT